MSTRRLLHGNNQRGLIVPFQLAVPGTYGPLGGISSFARPDASTCAQYVTNASALAAVAANVLRDAHYIRGVRTILVEDTRANRVLRSDEQHTTWTQNGANLVTVDGVGTYAGRPFSSISRGAGTWGSNYTAQVVAFTGNGSKEVNILIKQNGTAAGTFPFFLQNGGGTNRLAVTVTIAANGTISAAASIGTVVATFALGDGVYLLQCLAAGVLAADTNIVYMGSANTASPVNSALISGVHASNGTICRMPIATVAAVVTQAADALTFAGVAITGTLFYHFFDLATQAWTDAVAAYVASTAITPAIDRAYSHIAVVQGTRTAAECKAIIGGYFP